MTTAAMAFLSRSVMTLAEADRAAHIMAAATSTLRRFACMLRSSGCRQPRLRITAATLSRRVFGVNEPKGSQICSRGGRTSARNPYELWIFVTLPDHRKVILWYYDRNAVSALHARNERG